MAVLGNNTSSETVSDTSQYQFKGSIFTASEDGTIDDINFYGRRIGGPGDAVGVVYDHSDGSLVAQGGTVAVESSNSWHTSTASSESFSNGDVLIIGFIPCDGSFRLGYAAGDTNQGHYDSQSDCTADDPSSGFSHENREYCCYINYTGAGGAATHGGWVQRGGWFCRRLP